ncbi:TolC family protein, partial [Pseudomonas sp. FSL R10-0071]|uniref:TolC family protein n=1 Tax=Pseudomonas sp. FSL R10-0071 TaxID=2662193 RepID=UPI003532228C
MSVRRLCSAVLMLGAVLASPVQALGLLEAYDLAVRNDPTFQAAIEERAAGQENRALGRSALLPTLACNYSNSRNESEV